MKKLNFKKRKNTILTMAGVLYGMVFFPTIVQAADALAKITNGVNAVKTFFVGVAAAVGIIIFVRNAQDFGVAIQDRDRNGMMNGLLGMIGGGVMALAGSIVTIFGLTS